MDETEEMRQAELQAQALRQALEANDRAAAQFLSRAGQVHSAYAYALGQVRAELNALERSFQGAAASVMGAFASALNSARPALNRLASAVTSVFGVTYWKSSSKGMDQAAASLGRVARSARSVAQAQRDLYSFDKITRVSPERGGGSASGGSSGRAAAGGGSAGGAWVRIPGLLDGIAAKAKSVLAQIWKPMAQAWTQQGEQTVSAVLSALTGISAAAQAVGRSWLKAWTGGAGVQAVGSVLSIVEKLSLSAAALAGNFRRAWETAGLGDGIMLRLFALVQSVLNTVERMAEATVQWERGVDFMPLLKGFSAVLEAAKPLSDLLGGALSRGYREVLLPIAGWTLGEAVPAMLRLLAQVLNLLTAALERLKPVAQFVWERLLKPMAQWSGEGLIQNVNSAAAGFRVLSGVLSNLPNGWGELKKRTADVWSGIANVLTGKARESKNSVTGAFRSMSQGAAKSGSSLNVKLNSVFARITSNARSRFSNISGYITTPFRGGLNGVVALANTMIHRLNSSMKLSWPSVKVAGKTLLSGGSARLLNMPTIARLAQGGVTTGPALSLIGEAGREAVLPLERNTGWMDELARRLESGRGGQTVIEIHIGSERLVRQVVDGVNDLTRRTGVCPIYL